MHVEGDREVTQSKRKGRFGRWGDIKTIAVTLQPHAVRLNYETIELVLYMKFSTSRKETENSQKKKYRHQIAQLRQQTSSPLNYTNLSS